MIWNLIRIKATTFSIICLFIAVSCSLDIFRVIGVFTPFEKIVLCLLAFISLMIPMFGLYYGIEPITPDIRIFEPKEGEGD